MTTRLAIRPLPPTAAGHPYALVGDDGLVIAIVTFTREGRVALTEAAETACTSPPWIVRGLTPDGTLIVRILVHP